MKLRHSFAMTLVSLLAATLLCTVVHPVQGAQASSCKNIGGASKSLNYSSQVQGTVFTLCGKLAIKKITLIRTKSVSKQKPTIKLKPVKPVKPAKFKTKPVSKSKTKVVKRKSTKKSKGYANFRPVTPVASVNITEIINPNQIAKFKLISKVHYRPTRLLGFSARVRFTPKVVRWQFSDGFSSNLLNPKHGFKANGSYRARAIVTFAVAYRFDASGSWVHEPARISLFSNSVTVLVGQDSKTAPKPYLVNNACRATQSTGINAIGCHG